MTQSPLRPTTRSILLGSVDEEGRLPAAVAHRIGAAYGYTEDQVRHCLARLVHEGLLTKSGRGRAATFVSTQKHQDALEPSLQWLGLAYAQDRGAAPWDGHWTLISFSVPERRREARNALREHLVHTGMAALAPATYVSAHDAREGLEQTAQQLDLTDHVSVARTDDLVVMGRRAPTEIAAVLWPLESLAASYRAFCQRFARPLRKPRASSVDAMVTLSIEMTAAFEACIADDPLLPPELLPQLWPGRDARALLAKGATEFAAVQHELPNLGFDRYQRLLERLEGGDDAR